MKYSIEGACKSVIGNVRTNNEDNYFFNYKTLKEENEGSKLVSMNFENVDNVVGAVFDGMGGEERGERASFLASSTLRSYIEKNQNQEFRLKDYIEEANQNIVSELTGNQLMGTTVAMALFTEEEIQICNLGDSRIYGYHDGVLTQLSKDHTENELQKKLNISSSKKGKLTQHLGIPKSEFTLVPYIDKIPYQKYEKILLCSDGLTDMLSNSEMIEILKKKETVKEQVDDLISASLEHGGVDNTTVMLFEMKKYRKTNPLFFAVPIVIFLILLVLMIPTVSKESFQILEDGYQGPISIGNRYPFRYQGKVTLEISNDNLKFEDGEMIAFKEGTSVVTLKDKEGKVVYQKTIKIFPR